MADKPILLLLHGVGPGERSDAWRATLERALAAAGYSGLDDVTVIAPKYAHALQGSDDDEPVPPVTVRSPSGDAARTNRRDFQRRMGSIEIVLGGHDRGSGWIGADAVASAALAQPYFEQAANYLTKSRIRAHVLQRILRRVPQAGRLVIVGHSLGSVIAADLVRRLPVGVSVEGMVTVGSPLAHPKFEVERLRDALREPPTNLGWWVNFWNAGDPVTTHRGISSVFPWMLDFRIPTVMGLHCHDAEMYLANLAVAATIGRALFGSLSKELVPADGGVDIPLDYAETVALMALRYAHLTKARLEGDQHDRYADALRQVQASTVELVRLRNAREGRPLPAAIARLAVDLTDAESVPPQPQPVNHLSKEDAIVPLLSIAAANVLRPYEISVPAAVRRDAMEDLTAEMWLGGQIGADVIAATEESRKALASAGAASWLKWLAIGAGVAALVAATGGLALVAAPGAVGAAAITSALAAFGPGGMIGGLLTAGTLVTAGGGGIAFGLASPGTTAETVEAVVASQLAGAILRERQGLEQDPSTWSTLADTGIELRRELVRLSAFSDEAAPSLKELNRKIVAVDRALTYLSKHSLGTAPAAPEAEVASTEKSSRRQSLSAMRTKRSGDTRDDLG
ncbi:MAG: hypothetical protein QM779_05100 [Propionicimonas sp.]|uniref:hypothetical protein n=1 Tax=Propionicimonas sp. TaxID=1955623 RepID=UPI003D09CC56